MQPLTIDTLRQATRGIRNLLSELQIRCDFFDRGCAKFVELGYLERHVADCGFAPAVCSNVGCQLEVNKQDLLHHETAVCEQREVKAVEENVVAKVELVQQQLNKQEESNRRLEVEVVEIKKCLNEIMKQLERMTQQTSHKFQTEQMKKGIAEAVVGMEREPKVVIAGGKNKKGQLNSVEMFSLTNGTWTPLKQMKKRREGASSVVYNDHIFVSGGYAGGMNWLKSVEKLSLNAVQVDQSLPWENVAVELSGRLSGHCSVVYNERVMVIGGYDAERAVYSDSINEISLVPPYTRKLLATMPQRRGYHGVAIFRHMILIVGGRVTGLRNSPGRSVVMYDIIKKECQELAPLPYPVHEMATVKWDDDNVMIMGGADSNDQPLNNVLMYNIKTQKSHELTNMKYERKGCVAAVVRDTVIVMGGRDETGKYLKSAEGFRFDRNSWEELPLMHEGRWAATAVVC